MSCCYCFFYCLCPLFLVCRFPTFSGWQWLLGPLLPYSPLWAFRSLRPSAFVPGRLSFGCTLIGRGLLEVLYTLRAVRQPGVEGRCPAFGLISVGPRCASDSFFSGIPESCCSCLQGTLRSLPSGLCLSRMSRHILELLLSRRPSLPSSFLWGIYFFAPQWLGYLLLHCLQGPRSPGSCFGWLSDCDRMGTYWVLLFPFLFPARLWDCGRGLLYWWSGLLLPHLVSCLAPILQWHVHLLDGAFGGRAVPECCTPVRCWVVLASRLRHVVGFHLVVGDLAR